MAASVSSERAFSAAALTITKHCNRLKGDIVEALQVLRMMYNHDLIFPETAPSSAVEIALEEESEMKEGGGDKGKEKEEDLSWNLEFSEDSDTEA